jgi:crossover junction endodeoxyribonuclease RuvC
MFDSCVLGVDPGIAALGLAAVARQDRRPELLFAGTEAGLTVEEYGPLEVKMAVTGQGTADKRQVRDALARLHGLRDVPTEPDAADAVAVALCHLTQSRLRVAARSTKPSRTVDVTRLRA